jgi:hypothetical protein
MTTFTTVIITLAATVILAEAVYKYGTKILAFIGRKRDEANKAKKNRDQGRGLLYYLAVVAVILIILLVTAMLFKQIF